MSNNSTLHAIGTQLFSLFDHNILIAQLELTCEDINQEMIFYDNVMPLAASHDVFMMPGGEAFVQFGFNIKYVLEPYILHIDLCPNFTSCNSVTSKGSLNFSASNSDKTPSLLICNASKDCGTILLKYPERHIAQLTVLKAEIL